MTPDEMVALYREKIHIQARVMVIPPQCSWINHQDLEQEGILAALFLLKRYSESTARFWTYAEPRVVGAMKDAIRRTQWNRAGRVNRAGREGLQDEIFAWWRYVARTEYPHGSHPYVMQLLRDHERRQDAVDLRARVQAILDTLPLQWQHVYRQCVQDERKAIDVAPELGVCASRISQLLRHIVRRLQQGLTGAPAHSIVPRLYFGQDGTSVQTLRKHRLSYQARLQQRAARCLAKEAI